MSLEEMNLHDVEDYSSEVTHDQLPSVEEARTFSSRVGGKAGSKRQWMILGGVVIVFMTLLLIIVVPFDEKRDVPKTVASTPTSTPAASPSGIAFGAERVELELLEIALKGAGDFIDDSSYQYRSRSLLMDDPMVYDYDKEALQQRYALYCLYHATRSGEWLEAQGWKRKGVPECEWFGVTCDPDSQLVTRVNLRDNNIKGEIPDEITLLENLTVLNLNANPLEGEISDNICSFTDSQALDLLADCNVVECDCCSNCAP